MPLKGPGFCDSNTFSTRAMCVRTAVDEATPLLHEDGVQTPRVADGWRRVRSQRHRLPRTLCCNVEDNRSNDHFGNKRLIAINRFTYYESRTKAGNPKREFENSHDACNDSAATLSSLIGAILAYQKKHRATAPTSVSRPLAYHCFALWGWWQRTHSAAGLCWAALKRRGEGQKPPDLDEGAGNHINYGPAVLLRRSSILPPRVTDVGITDVVVAGTELRDAVPQMFRPIRFGSRLDRWCYGIAATRSPSRWWRISRHYRLFSDSCQAYRPRRSAKAPHHRAQAQTRHGTERPFPCFEKLSSARYQSTVYSSCGYHSGTCASSLLITTCSM